MKKKISLIALFLTLLSCNTTHYKNPTVKISTIFGDIIVEVYPDKAPLSAEAFLKNIQAGVYKESNFYRVLKAEDQPMNAPKVDLIQGGIFLSNSVLSGEKKGIPLESTGETGLVHEDGTISFARTTPDSGGLEFFICLGRLSAYDEGGAASADGLGYAAFGKVIDGMRIVRRIHDQSSEGPYFKPPILIKKIKYLNPPKK